MPTPKKIETVKNLEDKVAKAKSMVLTDYRGLKHKQLEDLRRILKKIDSELVVAKNRLIKRALGDKASEITNSLEGATAALFAYADEVAPVKELLKFFKSTGVGQTKGGLLGTQTLSELEVTRLAELPSRQVLLTQLAGQLNAPIQGLHYALNWNINRFVWALNAILETKNKS